jgi:hypothetical protein
MKIEITPKAVELFNEEGKPAIMTIGNKGITFNKIAERQLALKPEASFLLDFDEGILFYKESTEGFKIHLTGKYQLPSSTVQNCAKYIDKFFKKNINTFRFEIGEFKEGRRKLTLLN